MQYQLAFGYFYGQKPNGWTNVLLATVCLFIPVVGPLVFLGYQAEVSERLIRDPDLRRYPDFKFDRFMELLTRGLWPFLLSLIAAVVFVPLLIGGVFASIAVGAAMNSPGVGFVLAFAVYFCGIVGMNAVMIPVQFYGEMSNRFDLGGAFRFTFSFAKLVGGRAVVAFFVLMLLSIPLTFVGMLACFVGVYPASIIAAMAGQHLMVQLYLDYLDRGGEEIVKTPTDEEKRRQRRREREEDERYDDDDRR